MIKYKKIMLSIVLSIGLIFLNKLSCFAMDEYNFENVSTDDEDKQENVPFTHIELALDVENPTELYKKYRALYLLSQSFDDPKVMFLNKKFERVYVYFDRYDELGIYMINTDGKRIYIDFKTTQPYEIASYNVTYVVDEDGLVVDKIKRIYQPKKISLYNEFSLDSESFTTDSYKSSSLFYTKHKALFEGSLSFDKPEVVFLNKDNERIYIDFDCNDERSIYMLNINNEKIYIDFGKTSPKDIVSSDVTYRVDENGKVIQKICGILKGLKKISKTN